MELLSLSVISKSLEKKKPPQGLTLVSFITKKHYSVSANSFLALETCFEDFVFLVI